MRMQMKNIICTTDFSDISDQAVPYAMALAREFKAKLHLCHIIDLSSVAMYGEAVVALQEQQNRMTRYAQERLNRLIADEDLDWEPVITVGHAGDQICRVAKEVNADLVVASTQGRSGLKRLILGSVTQRLMKALPCPLLVVRGVESKGEVPPAQELPFKRILVGCDFSPDSDLALRYAISLAQEFQSALHLVHVIEPSLYKDLVRPAREATSDVQQDLRDQLNGKLKALVPQEALNWCDPQTILLAGQPHEELTKYAVVQKADLIVLGVRGHGVMETLLVGSTTDRVSGQAPCPVLSVRPMVQAL